MRTWAVIVENIIYAINLVKTFSKPCLRMTMIHTKGKWVSDVCKIVFKDKWEIVSIRTLKSNLLACYK